MSLFDDMLSTMEEVGFEYLSNEKCCEVLALVYYFGSESMVLNPIFYRVIIYAQDKLNVHGGEIVNVELLPMLQTKIKELESKTLPDWTNEIADRYNIVLAI